ncbi:hypothetical protein EBU99_01130 [bacterium]|nr:hypothetical protein [bacterium]
MSELKLKPELLPMVIQGGFYLAALASSHFLLVKPLVALTLERKRRTQGAVESAKGLEAKLEKLEKTYTSAHQAALSEARELRNAQILAGQAEAQGILAEAQESAKNKLHTVRLSLAEQVSTERTKIPAMVAELSDSVLKKLVQSCFIVSVFASSFLSLQASASQGMVDPVYGILWPYFQFIVFAAALTYLARKAIGQMLEGRRDALRTQLSEAREAMTLAQRKSDEYESKLKNLQNEIEALRKEFADDGVAQRDKLITEASATAAQIIRDTERIGQQMISEGRAELRREIFEQVLAVIDGKLHGDTLTNIDKTLRQNAIAAAKASAQTSHTN